MSKIMGNIGKKLQHLDGLVKMLATEGAEKRFAFIISVLLLTDLAILLDIPVLRKVIL